MPSIIGDAFVQIRPETTGFQEDLKKKLSGFGTAGVVAGAVAAVGIGVGAALLDIGSRFEDAFNKIKVATGATGVQLKGLEGSFKAVFSTSASSMSDVATAVSEVSVRTHLTGSALDDLSKKFVDLSRITGTSVASNVQTVTALFGNFGIAAKNQSAELDVLFKASQKSGVGIDTLTSSIQAAAPVAQTLGLSFNQTTALVAQLTEAGLPATKVMMGLGTEFAKAAKAGKDPTAVIGQMVAEIKKAPNATIAAQLAVKDFGASARTAATLVDAVRAGTLNFGATLGAITSGGGGINAATQATLTLGDKFKILKNSALTALEPIAMKVVDFANVLADKIPSAVHTVEGVVRPFFNDIKTLWSDLIAGFRGDPAQLFPGLAGLQKIVIGIGDGIFKAFGIIKTAWNDLRAGFSGNFDMSGLVGWHRIVVEIGVVSKTVFTWIKDNLKPILIGAAVAFGLLTAPVTTVIAGVAILYIRFKAFRDVVAEVVAGVRVVAGYIGAQLHEAFVKLEPPITRLVKEVLPRMEQAFKAIAPVVKVIGEVIGGVLLVALSRVVPILSAVADVLANVLKPALDVIADVIQFLGDLLTGHFSKALGDVGKIIQDLGRTVLAALEGIPTLLGGIFGNLGSIILNKLGGVASDVGAFFASLPGKAVAGLAALGDALVTAFKNGITALVTKLPGLLVDLGIFFTIKLPLLIVVWTAQAGVWLLGVGVKMIVGFVTDLISALPTVAKFFLDLPGKILGFIGNAAAWLFNVGKDILTGICNGLVAAVPALLKFWVDLPGKILGLLSDAGSWLIHVGEAIIEGLIKGLGNAGGKLEAKVKDAILGPIKHLPVIGGLIGSPSPYFTTVGEAIMDGLTQGIANKANLPQRALAGVNIGGPSVAPLGGANPTALNAATATTTLTAATASQTKATIDTNKILEQMFEFMRQHPPLQSTDLRAVTQNTVALTNATQAINELRTEQVIRGR